MLELTLEQLVEHDGSDPGKPLYISVQGRIFDVTAGAQFYGPGGPYKLFGGRECARALAFMKVDPAWIGTADLSGAEERQLKTLADWVAKFEQKYPVVGRVKADS